MCALSLSFAVFLSYKKLQKGQLFRNGRNGRETEATTAPRTARSGWRRVVAINGTPQNPRTLPEFKKFVAVSYKKFTHTDYMRSPRARRGAPAARRALSVLEGQFLTHGTLAVPCQVVRA